MLRYTTNHESRICLAEIHLTKRRTRQRNELGKGEAKVSSLRESDQREVILNIKKKHFIKLFLSYWSSNYVNCFHRVSC